MVRNITLKKQWSSVEWRKFIKVMRHAKTVVVCGHIRPDGDTIGSSLAMKRALEQLGKEVLVINGFNVPPALSFLDEKQEVRKISSLKRAEKRFIENADVLMTVDVSASAQLGPDACELIDEFIGDVVVIDHHEVGGSIGDVRCVDANADSAGSLVYEAVEALGAELTYDIAFPLYVAIATDTGFFRFASTSQGTFERAAALVAAGVSVDEVYRLAMEQDSYGRFKLLGRASDNSERFLGDRGVFSYLSRADFDSAGAIPADCEDLVNEPLAVAGTEVSIIAIEQQDKSVKASFRSRCDLDCAALAKEFGGGGHRKAAGASLPGPLAKACKALKAKTEEYYELLNAPESVEEEEEAAPRVRRPRSMKIRRKRAAKPAAPVVEVETVQEEEAPKTRKAVKASALKKPGMKKSALASLAAAAAASVKRVVEEKKVPAKRGRKPKSASVVEEAPAVKVPAKRGRKPKSAPVVEEAPAAVKAPAKRARKPVMKSVEVEEEPAKRVRRLSSLMRQKRARKAK